MAEGISGRADDLIIHKGARFYPVQVEGVVRAFPELADEFCVEISTDERKGTDVVTVVAETASEEREGIQERLRNALAQSLGVAPELRLISVGSLERTAFKARRVVDLRRSS